MSRFEVITHEPPVVDAPTPQIQGDQSVPPSGGSRFEVIEHEPVDRGTPPDISPENRFQTIRNKVERVQPSPKNRDPSKFDPDSFNWSGFGLKPSLIKSVAAIESDFNPGILSQPDKYDKQGKERPAHVRAAGLMQMRAPAWEDANKILGTDYPLSARFDPEINARMGAAYLKHMIDRAGGDTRKGLAMYYAGEGGYRSNPKLKREGDVYANKILNKQRDFEREMLKQQREEEMAEYGPGQRAGLAAVEGVGSAIMAVPQIGVLAADLVKWGLGHDDAFQMSSDFSKALEMIPDEDKSLAERMISYGVSSLSLGGQIRNITNIGGVFDRFYDMVAAPFVKKNVAGFSVGALAGATDHYSRDTVFEGWSPALAGIGGALLLRNVGNDNVVRAFEGTMKLPGDVIAGDLSTAISNTPNQVAGNMTTAQIMGDPALASLQNRMAMYEEPGSALNITLRNQSRDLHRKGLEQFPGDERAVLGQLQQEAKELEDQIASFIGNPSRVEGEVQLNNFLRTNRNKIMSKKNKLYDMAKPYPITINVDPIEDVLEGFINRVWQTGTEPVAVRSVKEALYEHKKHAETDDHRLRKGEQIDFTTLKEVWEDLGANALKYDREAEKIREHLKNMAVDPVSNPDGWEYASAASTFHNGLLDIYQPMTEAGERTKDTLLYRESQKPKPKPGELPPRTGLSSYEDVMDIRRLSRPVQAVNHPEFVTATQEQIKRALDPVLRSQLAGEAYEPVSGKLRPGHAAEYLAKKGDVYEAAGFEDQQNIFQLDKRAGQVEGIRKDLESTSILEATLNVLKNPRTFNDFVEVTAQYGATGKQDFTRLAATSLLGEMFPENIARSSAQPGSRTASTFDASPLIDSLDKYSTSRMLDPNQREFLIALNQARAGISEAAGAGEMSPERLRAAVPNSILYNIVKATKNAFLREHSDVAAVMSKRDARLLAAALHDPKIAKKILSYSPRSAKGVDVWYADMEGTMNNWQRGFLRDLQKGNIVAKKINETMGRMGMRQYLMEETRTDRSTEEGRKAGAAKWEDLKGVFQ